MVIPHTLQLRPRTGSFSRCVFRGWGNGSSVPVRQWIAVLHFSFVTGYPDILVFT